MLIEVTEDDIKRGNQYSCYTCPIALAVCRLFPDANVQVSSYRITVETGDGFEYFYLPREAKNFIQNFDGGRSVQPFSFATI